MTEQKPTIRFHGLAGSVDFGAYAELGIQHAEANAERQEQIINLLERIAKALESRVPLVTSVTP